MQQKSVKCKKLLWPNSEKEVEWQLELGGSRFLSPLQILINFQSTSQSCRQPLLERLLIWLISFHVCILRYSSESSSQYESFWYLDFLGCAQSYRSDGETQAMCLVLNRTLPIQTSQITEVRCEHSDCMHCHQKSILLPSEYVHFHFLLPTPSDQFHFHPTSGPVPDFILAVYSEK